MANKPDFLTRPLAERFFGALVDEAVGGKDGVRLKPHPDAVLLLLESFGADTSECAYIGDTSVDMQTGKNLGARITIGVPWGFRSVDELASNGADVIVNNPLQILDEVSKLG